MPLKNQHVKEKNTFIFPNTISDKYALVGAGRVASRVVLEGSLGVSHLVALIGPLQHLTTEVLVDVKRFGRQVLKI